MMDDDAILAVVQAHKEGKTIEYRISEKGLSEHEGWGNPTSGLRMEWNFSRYDYRVAPEPRKPRDWWIHPKTFPDVEFEKDRILTEQPLNPAWIHVVEVLE